MHAPDLVLFRSPSRHAKLVTAAFLLYVVGVAWTAIGGIRVIGYVRDAQAGSQIDLAALARLTTQLDGYQWKLCAAQLLGIVFFLMWMHRVAANVRAFGVDDIPADAAVGSFFIPLVNLWKPYRVLSAIWVASTPTRPSYAPISASPLLLLWWLTWTVARISSVYVNMTSVEPAEPAAVISTLHVAIALLAVEMFALLLMFAVVWGLTRLQEQRAAAGLATATIVDR